MTPQILHQAQTEGDYSREETISVLPIVGDDVIVFRDVTHRTKSGSVAACSQSSVRVSGVVLHVEDGAASLRRVR